MASSSSWALLFLVSTILVATANAGNFYQEVNITWGNGRAKILEGGLLLTESLDNISGSGFQSYNEYLFGQIEAQIKLVPGNSAGTVTCFFISSEGAAHDEVDFEFLGNVTGQPYTLHTNIFTQGIGDREVQFRLWFDPTTEFHTYTILWNPQNVIWFVDGIPVRDFKNNERVGIAFPDKQPMKLYSSLWDAEDWATEGGRIKTDWTLAPFIASFQNYNADACVWSNGASHCTSYAWYNQSLDSVAIAKMKGIQSSFMIYNYCTDAKRFPQGFPPECSIA